MNRRSLFRKEVFLYNQEKRLGNALASYSPAYDAIGACALLLVSYIACVFFFGTIEEKYLVVVGAEIKPRHRYVEALSTGSNLNAHVKVGDHVRPGQVLGTYVTTIADTHLDYGEATDLLSLFRLRDKLYRELYLKERIDDKSIAQLTSSLILGESMKNLESPAINIQSDKAKRHSLHDQYDNLNEILVRMRSPIPISIYSAQYGTVSSVYDSYYFLKGDALFEINTEEEFIELTALVSIEDIAGFAEGNKVSVVLFETGAELRAPIDATVTSVARQPTYAQLNNDYRSSVPVYVVGLDSQRLFDSISESEKNILTSRAHVSHLVVGQKPIKEQLF